MTLMRKWGCEVVVEELITKYASVDNAAVGMPSKIGSNETLVMRRLVVASYGE